MVSCCKLFGDTAFVLDVRYRCSMGTVCSTSLVFWNRIIRACKNFKTLPNCLHWGTQLALRLLRAPKWWAPGPRECIPGRLPLPPLGHRGGDGRGRFTSTSGPGPDHGEGSRFCRTQAPACSQGRPSPLLAWGQVNWRLKGRWPGSPSYFTPPDDNYHSTNFWPNGPLMVTQQEVLACGRDPLWHQPMAERRQLMSLRNCCLVTGYGLLACSIGKLW